MIVVVTALLLLFVIVCFQSLPCHLSSLSSWFWVPSMFPGAVSGSNADLYICFNWFWSFISFLLFSSLHYSSLPSLLLSPPHPRPLWCWSLNTRPNACQTTLHHWVISAVFCFDILGRVSLRCLSWSWTHCEIQASLELGISMTQSPEQLHLQPCTTVSGLADLDSLFSSASLSSPYWSWVLDPSPLSPRFWGYRHEPTWLLLWSADNRDPGSYCLLGKYFTSFWVISQPGKLQIMSLLTLYGDHNWVTAPSGDHSFFMLKLSYVPAPKAVECVKVSRKLLDHIYAWKGQPRRLASSLLSVLQDGFLWSRFPRGFTLDCQHLGCSLC